jgi:hypothetical protein
VAQAISPDNIEVPKGLVIQTTHKRSKVHTLIICRKKMATFIATIDDLLACISVAEKSYSLIEP